VLYIDLPSCPRNHLLCFRDDPLCYDDMLSSSHFMLPRLPVMFRWQIVQVPLTIPLNSHDSWKFLVNSRNNQLKSRDSRIRNSNSQYDCVSNMKTNYAKFFPLKSIGGTFFSFGNLATGHFSGNFFWHSSGHTGSNGTGLESLSRRGAEKKSGHTDIQTE
jgi:hypothetical protein